MRFKKVIFVFAIILLHSCAGYRLGGVKPQKFSDINSIAVSHFKNLTLEPRLSVLATNSFVDALAQDGTYAILNSMRADATLIASVRTIEYKQYRSNRFDSLASDELRTTVYIDWALKKGDLTLSKGTSSGQTVFFVADNLHTSRSNALPLAVSRASQSIVSKLTEGF